MRQRDYSWQRRCIDDIRRAMARGQRDYLVNATPGSGKTDLACALAKELVEDGTVDFVVVVVPNLVIQGQFIQTMKAVGGLILEPIVSGEAWTKIESVGLGSKAKGFCLTTAMLLQVSDKLKGFTNRHKVLWVSDEAHHNADGLAWGNAAIYASGDAVLRLGLSGTPYREDDYEIPFLHYNEHGVGVPHFEFTYQQAREAGLVTKIRFRAMTGWMDVVDTRYLGPDKVHLDLKDVPANDQKARERLQYLLHQDSPYIYVGVKRADAVLRKIQRMHENAGGMVFANNIKQARYIGKLIRDQLGRSVIVVVGDDDAPTKVAAFNAGNQDWIVQVRKVYEGTNIPRLRVGVWLSSWITQGYFEQGSKRLVRIPDGMDAGGSGAIMFFPDDRRIWALAKGLGPVRRHVIAATSLRNGQWQKWEGPYIALEDRHPGTFQVLGGGGYLTGALIDGREYTLEDIQRIEAYFETDPDARLWDTMMKLDFYHYFSMREGGLAVFEDLRVARRQGS